MKRQQPAGHAHRDPANGKVENFTHTQIDSIPKENRYNSMLNRKTLPGGKNLPKALVHTSGDSAFKNNVGSSIAFKQSHSPQENRGDGIVKKQ